MILACKQAFRELIISSWHFPLDVNTSLFSYLSEFFSLHPVGDVTKEEL